MVYHLRSLIGSRHTTTEDGQGFWVRAVPGRFYGGIIERAMDAWEVLRDRAVAVHWPKAGELERALEE